jgi:hypothetical protein
LEENGIQIYRSAGSLVENHSEQGCSKDIGIFQARKWRGYQASKYTLGCFARKEGVKKFSVEEKSGGGYRAELTTKIDTTVIVEYDPERREYGIAVAPRELSETAQYSWAYIESKENGYLVPSEEDTTMKAAERITTTIDTLKEMYGQGQRDVDGVVDTLWVRSVDSILDAVLDNRTSLVQVHNVSLDDAFEAIEAFAEVEIIQDITAMHTAKGATLYVNGYHGKSLHVAYDPEQDKATVSHFRANKGESIEGLAKRLRNTQLEMVDIEIDGGIGVRVERINLGYIVKPTDQGIRVRHLEARTHGPSYTKWRGREAVYESVKKAGEGVKDSLTKALSDPTIFQRRHATQGVRVVFLEWARRHDNTDIYTGPDKEELYSHLKDAVQEAQCDAIGAMLTALKSVYDPIPVKEATPKRKQVAVEPRRPKQKPPEETDHPAIDEFYQFG